MSEAPASPAPTPAARIRSRSRSERLARQRERATNDARLMNLLASGVSTAELALQDGVSLRRMHDRIAAMLARREAESPASFAPLQIARFGDAMKVAYAAMMDGDLKALDRVLRIARELERYQGYRSPEPPALAPATQPVRLAAPVAPRALPAPDETPTTGYCIASD